MAVLCAHNTVFGSKCSAVCAQAVYMLCSNLVKFGRREMGKIVRCLPKILPDFPAVATARIAPKICQEWTSLRHMASLI